MVNRRNVERVVLMITNLQAQDRALKQETISAVLLAYQSSVWDRPVGLFMDGCEEFVAHMTINDIFRWLGVNSAVDRTWIGGLHWFARNPVMLRTIDIQRYAMAVLRRNRFILQRHDIFPKEPQNDNQVTAE